MRELRKHNFSDAINQYFRLGKDLNQRDTIAVKRTVSGLVKLLFPDGKFTKDDIRKCLEYALVGRRRIKEQINGIGNIKGLELAIFLSIVSGLTERPLLTQLAVLGSMSIGETIIGSDNLADFLQVAADSGTKKVLIPAIDMIQIGEVPTDLIACLYKSAISDIVFLVIA